MSLAFSPLGSLPVIAKNPGFAAGVSPPLAINSEGPGKRKRAIQSENIGSLGW
jgi:hypothetical protein